MIFVSQGFFRHQRDDQPRLAELAALAAGRANEHLRVPARREPERRDAFTGTLNPAFSADDRRERRPGLETLTASARGTLFDLVGTGTSVFERLSTELSGYYLVGVEPDARDQDGKPHPIRSSVGERHDRPHASRDDVRRRRTPRPPARTPREIVTAALSSPLPASSLPVRAMAFAFRGLDSGKVRLLIHAEIGSSYTSPQRMAVGYYVVDKDGKTLDGQVSEVRLAPAVSRHSLVARLLGGASVDPGEYTVKIAVADGDRIGSLDLPVHAALLDLGKVSLTELIAGGPMPPVNLLRPSVGTRVSYGTVHGYLEAYGPEAATLGVRSRSPRKNGDRRFSERTSRAKSSATSA